MNQNESGTGQCRFCGQRIMINGGAEMTEPQREEAATMQCDCDTAQKYQQIAKRGEKAKERIRELAGDAAEEQFQQPEAVREIMMTAVDALCREEIDAINVIIGQELKYKFTRTKKGNIKIVREIKKNKEFVQ